MTLDPEVAEALKAEAFRSGRSFKAVVNEAIRAGLAQRRGAPKAKRYRLEPSSLGGVVPCIDLDRALRLADALEDEAIARELEARK